MEDAIRTERAEAKPSITSDGGAPAAMQSARNALRQSAFGENCVIGAGSVVTRDIPANSFAAGVPAGVIRPITQKDAIANLFDDLH